jgi:hypothetical protein
MVVHGFGDKDIHLIRDILAANGHYALNMRDLAAMGIQDPRGKKYHRGDWLEKKLGGTLANTMGTHHQSSTQECHPCYGSVSGMAQHCEYTVNFLGGKRAKPRGYHGVISFAMGRGPVGEGSWEPRFPTAHLDATLGVVPGKQQSMGLANYLQDEVIRRLGIVDPEAQYTENDVGVFHHTLGLDRQRPNTYT